MKINQILILDKPLKKRTNSYKNIITKQLNTHTHTERQNTHGFGKRIVNKNKVNTKYIGRTNQWKCKQRLQKAWTSQKSEQYVKERNKINSSKECKNNKSYSRRPARRLLKWWKETMQTIIPETDIHCQ